MNFLAVDRPLGLLVGLQERDQARAADGDEGAVNVGRHLLSVGRVVRRVQRREDPLGDLAARGAELRDEAGRRRPAEAVVVGDDRGLPPPELVVGEVAEAGVPLRAVAVEAEEVRRLHLERRVLRARGAVDERLVRVLLGVVGDRDRLVTRERADHDVGVQLLHQATRLLDRRVALSSPQPTPTSLSGWSPMAPPVKPSFGSFGSFGLAPANCGERRHRAGHVLLVERAERALALGHDRDLDRRARAALARRHRGLRFGRVDRRCCGRRVVRGRRWLCSTSCCLPPPELPQPAATNARATMVSASQNSPPARSS